MRTQISISFVGKSQLPYFMIIKEYIKDNGNIEHAEVIYQEEYRMSEIKITGDVIIGSSKKFICKCADVNLLAPIQNTI